MTARVGVVLFPGSNCEHDVVEATRQRYVRAYELLTGRSFADWYGVRP